MQRSGSLLPLNPKTNNKRGKLKMNSGLLAALLILMGVATGQTGQQASEDSLLERARKGDDAALFEMERTGDLKDLRSLLHDHDYAAKFSVRLKLARMGDTESLQYFACLSLTDDVDKMQLLLRDDYDHIVGAFTVQIYRQLLDSDPRFLAFVKRHRKHRYSDVIVRLPSAMVLQYLPKLLPYAKIPKPFFDDPSEDNTKLKWRSWIDEYRNEIQHMQPSASDVNFSSSFCAGFDKRVAAAK